MTLHEDMLAGDAIRQNANAKSIENAFLDSLDRIAKEPPKPWVTVMPTWLYRWHCTNLAFCEAWRMYGKRLGYT